MGSIQFVSNTRYWLIQLKDTLWAKIPLILLGISILGSAIHVLSGQPAPTLLNIVVWTGVILFFALFLVVIPFISGEVTKQFVGDQYGAVLGAAVFVLLLGVFIVWIPTQQFSQFNDLTPQFWAYPALIGVVVLMSSE